jgi:hypothetical protein
VMCIARIQEMDLRCPSARPWWDTACAWRIRPHSSVDGGPRNGVGSQARTPAAPGRGRSGVFRLCCQSPSAGDSELMRANKSGAAMQVVQMLQSFHDPVRWVEATYGARRSMQTQCARSCRHERSGS